MPDLIRWNAAEMMAVNVDARAAKPNFIRLLRDGSSQQQFCAIRALVNFIGPADASCVPVLIQKLQSPQPAVCSLAIVALDRIGPRARAAGPALAKLLDSPDPQVRERAALTLKRIDPETAAKQKTK